MKRAVPITLEEIRLVEAGAKALIRDRRIREGFKLAGLALKWRYQHGFGGELTDDEQPAPPLRVLEGGSR
jgi:hypothetical protein